TNPSRRANSRATLLLPEAAGPSIATMVRARADFIASCAPALFLLDSCRRKRGNHRSGRAEALRVRDFVQHLCETWKGRCNAVDVLNDGLAFGEKSGDRESHRDAVIAET